VGSKRGDTHVRLDSASICTSARQSLSCADVSAFRRQSFAEPARTLVALPHHLVNVIMAWQISGKGQRVSTAAFWKMTTCTSELFLESRGYVDERSSFDLNIRNPILVARKH
jgi:hypothetical protein